MKRLIKVETCEWTAFIIVLRSAMLLCLLITKTIL